MDKLEMIKQKEFFSMKANYYRRKEKQIRKRQEKMIENCEHGIVIFHGSTVVSHAAECLFCGANHSQHNVIHFGKNFVDMSKYVEGDPLETSSRNYTRVKMAYQQAVKEKPDITDEEAVKRIDEILIKEM